MSVTLEPRRGGIIADTRLTSRSEVARPSALKVAPRRPSIRGEPG